MTKKSIDWAAVRHAEEALGIENGAFARGFLYTPLPVVLPHQLSHFKRVETRGGFLYYDSMRLTAESAFGNEADIWVLGTAFSLNQPMEISPAEHLLQEWEESEERFHEALDWFSGRFVVLLFSAQENRVYHDALATRTVYYHDEGLVASHLNLLEIVADTSFRNRPFRGVQVYRWFDETNRNEIRSLLANRYLSISGPKIETFRYWPRNENIYLDLGENERLATIVNLWRQSLESLASLSEPVLSITGGQDSRLMLALSLPGRKDLPLFTYMPPRELIENDDDFWSVTYREDQRIVNEICSDLNLNHSYLTSKDKDAADQISPLVMLNRHGHPHGHWVVELLTRTFAARNATHLRGNFLEAMRHEAYARHDSTDLEGLLSVAKNISEKALGRKAWSSLEQYELQQIKKLREFGYLQLPHSYDKGPVLYCESRTSQWLGELANEHDIAFDTFLPHSNRKILELMWSTSKEYRYDDLLFRGLINASTPVLNFYPVNSSLNLFDEWRKALSQGVRRTQSISEDLHDLIQSEVLAEYQLNELRTISGDNEVETIKLHDGGFQIPTDRFDSRYRHETNTVEMDTAGDVHLLVRQTYSNPAGAKMIEFNLYVNDAMVASFDPAVTEPLMHVEILGVKAGDRIRGEFVHNVQKNYRSWRKASITELSKLVLTKIDSSDHYSSGIQVRQTVLR